MEGRPATTDGPASPVSSGTEAECGEAIEAPDVQCLPADQAELNDDENPATLEVAPGCGYIVANLTANEDDAYAFAPEKSDPIRVELAYTTAGTSDLEYFLRGPDGRTITTQRKDREAPREDIVSVFQATQGAQYAVEIAATSGKAMCQSYALRVDPRWCTDAHEDNDAIERATKLSWNAQELATAEGTISSNDDDFFEVTTVRADPVLLTGEYRASPGSTILVRRIVSDATGDTVVDKVGDRDGEVETFSHWLQAKSKGTVLRARLLPSGSGCAPFQITFDAAACTDDHEDNDSAAAASPLPSGRDLEVTTSSGDEDNYRIDALANGGSCTITYAVPVGRSQQLRVEVYNVAGAQVTNGLGGELIGAERQLRVDWETDRSVATIRVRADNGGYCQPYTIRCDAPEGL